MSVIYADKVEEEYKDNKFWNACKLIKQFGIKEAWYCANDKEEQIIYEEYDIFTDYSKKPYKKSIYLLGCTGLDIIKTFGFSNFKIMLAIQEIFTKKVQINDKEIILDVESNVSNYQCKILLNNK